MNALTFEETNLLCIYNPGSRLGAIEALTDSTIVKLRAMTDTEFSTLDLYLDFDK